MDGTVFLRKLRKNLRYRLWFYLQERMKGIRVDALDSGANDYTTKPFGSAELVARVRSVLRSTRGAMGNLAGGLFELNGLAIDYDSRQVFIDNKEIKLTQTEYNIIALLSGACRKGAYIYIYN